MKQTEKEKRLIIHHHSIDNHDSAVRFCEDEEESAERAGGAGRGAEGEASAGTGEEPERAEFSTGAEGRAGEEAVGDVNGTRAGDEEEEPEADEDETAVTLFI